MASASERITTFIPWDQIEEGARQQILNGLGLDWRTEISQHAAEQEHAEAEGVYLPDAQPKAGPPTAKQEPRPTKKSPEEGDEDDPNESEQANEDALDAITDAIITDAVGEEVAAVLR